MGGSRTTEEIEQKSGKVFRATYRLYYCEFRGSGCFSENRVIFYESRNGSGEWEREPHKLVPQDVVALFERLLDISRVQTGALA
ncbi:hypothetical protein A2886_02275 [candidate division WWE3 bacterium RIFCSPHIGHO2_01_FULL_42_13]|uniref:Uncharacterized protein n=1 Tax=candidate division WWE3 bacterium RIFCSPHIGHO2_01_FULL_42_13 TaxID=1802617 RepID=A0A1F4US20_UNCKA|nr:MAG: hypothetical protein A2886_02275 [candidate division WWE3 bacterium RIFCSPHIGHO2_01_FULL_42_13]